jgi:hypothetical protein
MRPLAAREVKMKKSMCGVLGLAVLFGALCTLGLTKEASAEVQVNINIVAPPPLQFAEPPDVYVVPSGSSYVYMVPNHDGVYFYGGNWYRFYNDRWFRSSHYNERWDYIETSHVPQVIIVVPPEYIHSVPSGYYRIHYDDFHSNWQSWDQGRHWDSYDWYQNERRDDTRRERHNSIESYRQQRGVQTQQHNVQQPQQRDMQAPQHQQEQVRQQHDGQKPQQRDVQAPQHQQEQVRQQHDGQKPQKQNVQKQQKQSSKKQKKQNGQKPQQHDDQKQQQQGEKEHGGNK